MYKFAIVGGDRRSAELAKLLINDRNTVAIYGFEDLMPGVQDRKSLKEVIDESSIIIGPLPFTNDHINVNAPFHTARIPMYEFLDMLNADHILISGMLDGEPGEYILKKNIKAFDLLDREEMAVYNAIPTAEGAIEIAMHETRSTVHGSNCLILGYGRIGKILSKMLDGIGAKVTVAARKPHDFAQISSFGYDSVEFAELDKALPDADIIFNTVPSMILNADKLKLLKTECLIIDLASKPGGVDFEKSAEMGIKTIWALSLPGKVAPLAAARYIKETIYNILNEWRDRKCF